MVAAAAAAVRLRPRLASRQRSTVSRFSQFNCFSGVLTRAQCCWRTPAARAVTREDCSAMPKRCNHSDGPPRAVCDSSSVISCDLNIISRSPDSCSASETCWAAWGGVWASRPFHPLRIGAGPEGRRTQQSLVLVSERQGKPWTWYLIRFIHTLMIQKHAFIMIIHPRQTLHTLPHLPGPRSV